MSQLQTVHLMDDDPAAACKLERFLEHFGYAVTQHATAGTLLEAVNDSGHGVVLLDRQTDGAAGLTLQTELAAGNITCPVIIMASNADVKTSVQAIKAGAVDFLEKPLNDSELLNSLRAAFSQANTTHQERELVNRLRDRFESLTPREQEVMRYVVNGTSNRALATHLKVSVRTVEVHRSRIKRKMGASNLTDLVRLADMLEIPARPAPLPELHSG